MIQPAQKEKRILIRHLLAPFHHNLPVYSFVFILITTFYLLLSTNVDAQSCLSTGQMCADISGNSLGTCCAPNTCQVTATGDYSTCEPPPQTVVRAPVPEPYVPCDQVRPDAWPPSNWFEKEWHSLRPYQASPCEVPIKEEELALLCGNDIIVTDTIRIPADDHRVVSCNPCTSCPGATTCIVEADRQFIVSLNAKASELPIAGNTELVAGNDPLPDWLQTILDSPIIPIPQDELRLTDWDSITPVVGSTHLPPDINDPKYKGIFGFREYYYDYRHWRGDDCAAIDIPIIGKVIMLCFDSPLNANFWSKLFPYIPYTSTEDRIGKSRVYDMVFDPDRSNVTISPNPPNTDWNPNPSRDERHQGLATGPDYGEGALFFPHMEENVELTSLLQSTYLPPEFMASPQPVTGPVKPTSPPNQQCKILDVRYNPGDQLFGETDPTDLGVPNATVTYTARFPCEAVCSPVGYGPSGELICGPPVPSCVKQAGFHADVETYTPMVDELWSKTVSGNASVVKKIYPKLEEDAPIEEFEDIPAVTDVLHELRQNDDPNSHVIVNSDPAEFYIPHFGDIYDNFLHGIQTALRPKGLPGQPAGLTKEYQIPEVDTVNEYVSWYLNGKIYRAEDTPLEMESDCLGESSQKPGICSFTPKIGRYPDGQSTCYGFPVEFCWVSPLGIPTTMLDRDKVINLTGPLNKLLSQHSQWRNMFPLNSVSYDEKTMELGRAIQPLTRKNKAKVTRHDQIAACIIGKSININIPIIGQINFSIGGYPIPCKTASQENLPPEMPSTGATPIPGVGSCDLCSIAAEYNVPCCFLTGIWDVETGRCVPGGDECEGVVNGGGTCSFSSSYGNYQCCNSAGACGPMQIMGGLVPPLSAGDNLDPCKLSDSWILAARLMVLKKCVAEGGCNSWDWVDGLQNTYPVAQTEPEVIGYYYGLVNGCYPDNASQCRWGQGISYCDAVLSWCSNNPGPLPDSCTQSYCDLIGQTCP